MGLISLFSIKKKTASNNPNTFLILLGITETLRQLTPIILFSNARHQYIQQIIQNGANTCCSGSVITNPGALPGNSLPLWILPSYFSIPPSLSQLFWPLQLISSNLSHFLALFSQLHFLQDALDLLAQLSLNISGW